MPFGSPLNGLLSCIPDDHAKQVSVSTLTLRFLEENKGISKVLDLGCGKGESKAFFREFSHNLDWKGVDIEDSPEVRERTEHGSEFLTFNGIDIPLESNSVDLVFSKHVLEHVRYPEKLLNDTFRVLKPGGVFIGSTSNLEPYHSFSYWNFTPYGLEQILIAAGMIPLEMRPGIDGLTLAYRQFLNRRLFLNRWWKRSPLNWIIDTAAYFRKWNVMKVNALKLHYCGHVCFVARKP